MDKCSNYEYEQDEEVEPNPPLFHFSGIEFVPENVAHVAHIAIPTFSHCEDGSPLYIVTPLNSIDQASELIGRLHSAINEWLNHIDNEYYEGLLIDEY